MPEDDILNRRFEELKRKSTEIERLPDFARLHARNALRDETESVVNDLLISIEQSEKKQSENTLKLFEVLDILRARDVAVMALKFARIGELIKRSLPNNPPQTDFDNHLIDNSQNSSEKNEDSNRSILRGIQQRSFTQEGMGYPCPQSDSIDFFHGEDTPALDYSHVVVLHLGFIGDDLVIGLDANTEQFLYGADFLKNGRRVNQNAFREYSYQHQDLSREKIIIDPYRRKNIKNEIRETIVNLFSMFYKTVTFHVNNETYVEHFESKEFPDANYFDIALSDLHSLLDFDFIMGKLSEWAEQNSISLEDICLVIAPDDILYAIPFGFLLDYEKKPLIKKIGGLSVTLSLVTLKYSLYRYHWRCAPLLNPDYPKCAFFGYTGEYLSSLDIESEVQKIKSGLGSPDRVFSFSNTPSSKIYATPSTLACWHSSAEICWISGHGSYSITNLPTDSGAIPFPLVGIELSEGTITNWNIISSDKWNFSPCWLIVLNACTVGRPMVVGSNPLGFIPSLYSMGAHSILSALWPVPDSSAIEFADLLSHNLTDMYTQTKCPRAKALKKTLVDLWDKNHGRNPFRFAGYFLTGLP